MSVLEIAITETAKYKPFDGTNATTSRPPGSLERAGKAMLRSLVPALTERKVSGDRYIKVNLANGEYVTGNSASETERRFAQMHPGDDGWLERFRDVVAEANISQSRQ